MPSAALAKRCWGRAPEFADDSRSSSLGEGGIAWRLPRRGGNAGRAVDDRRHRRRNTNVDRNTRGTPTGRPDGRTYRRCRQQQQRVHGGGEPSERRRQVDCGHRHALLSTTWSNRLARRGAHAWPLVPRARCYAECAPAPCTCMSGDAVPSVCSTAGGRRSVGAGVRGGADTPCNRRRRSGARQGQRRHAAAATRSVVTTPPPTCGRGSWRCRRSCAAACGCAAPAGTRPGERPAGG